MPQSQTFMLMSHLLKTQECYTRVINMLGDICNKTGLFLFLARALYYMLGFPYDYGADFYPSAYCFSYKRIKNTT